MKCIILTEKGEEGIKNQLPSKIRDALLEDFAIFIELVCFWLVIRKLIARLCILRLFSPVHY